MRVVEELEGPQSPEERAELIVYLIDMIEHWNAGIARHRSYAEPDLFTIDQFTERRNAYVEQLAILLQRYGLEFRPMQTTPPDQRQAA